MTLQLTALTILALSVVHPARADQAAAPSDLHSVAPALERYNEGLVESDLWKRPDLLPRDRSAVTISALIATGQTAALKPELNRALDNGVKPAELGAIMTHLAFYAGWPNALSAVPVAKAVFDKRPG
jgi:4-carboxymuconolactone decarboxylase